MSSLPAPSRSGSSSRAQAGRRARRQGAAFEQRLDLIHARYRAQGHPVLRVPHPVRRTKHRPGPGAPRGAYVAVDEDKGPCDYVALVEGVGVHFDAKTTSEPRWRLKNVKPEQAAVLDRWVSAGGHGAILLHFLASRETFWLPWAGALQPVWHRWHRGDAARGEASLQPATCAQLGWALYGARGIDSVDWRPVLAADLASR